MSNFLAVATVTCTLRQLLQTALNRDFSGAEVITLRPDAITKDPSKKGVNLFLYQATTNPSWRNADLPTRDSDGQVVQRPQVALDLHYLLTFFGNEGEFEPQRLLGSSVSTLHSRAVLDRELIRECVRNTPVLAGSDLADQFELVKFSPLPLNLEELSKMWSVFFQVPYHLSVAYQGTVVFIESALPAKAVLPVRSRGVFGTTLQRPFIEKLLSQENDTAPIVENEPILAGHNLIIAGKRLRGEHALVRVDEAVVALESLPESSDTLIKLPLVTQFIPDEVLRPGEHCVQIVHQLDLGTNQEPHRNVESNPVFFTLRASIIEPVVFSENPGITVRLNPKIGKEQEVVLLLNEKQTQPSAVPGHAYTFIAPRREQDVELITIPVSGIVPGEYLVRVQVDGAESPLKRDPATGRFIGPTVEVTTGAVTKKMRSSGIALNFEGAGNTITVNSAVTVQEILSQGEAPLSGVEVLATWILPGGSQQNQNRTTDNAGLASFSSPGPRGAYTFRVNNLIKAGYVFDASRSVLQRTLTVPGLNRMRSTSIGFEVSEQNNQFTVRGRVTILDNNDNPVPGATVNVNWQLPNNATPTQTAATDIQGVALFSATDGSGTYTLNVANVTKPDFTFDSANSVLTNSVVAPGEPLVVDEISFNGDFDKGDHIEIRWQAQVKDRTGARIEGASVTVRLAFPDGSARMETDPHTNELGHAVFEVNSQLRGTYTLTITEVSKPGYYFDQGRSVLSKTIVTEENPLRSESISFENIQFGDPVTIPGRVIVKDRTGAAVQNALVEARWTLPNGTTQDQEDSTNELGYAWLEITGSHGRYVLTVLNISKAGYTFDSANSFVSRSVTV